jgi:hypothetical protein
MKTIHSKPSGPLQQEALQAMHDAMADVIAEHKRFGLPLTILREGQIVEISAEEAEAEYLAAKAKAETNGDAAP